MTPTEVVIHTTHEAWGIFWLCFLAFLIVYAIGWWLALPGWYARRKHHNITEHKRYYTEHRPNLYLSDSRKEAARWALLWPVYLPANIVKRAVINHMTAEEQQEQRVAEARQIVADYEASQFAELEGPPNDPPRNVTDTLRGIASRGSERLGRLRARK